MKNRRKRDYLEHFMKVIMNNWKEKTYFDENGRKMDAKVAKEMLANYCAITPFCQYCQFVGLTAFEYYDITGDGKLELHHINEGETSKREYYDNYLRLHRGCHRMFQSHMKRLSALAMKIKQSE